MTEDFVATQFRNLGYSQEKIAEFFAYHKKYPWLWARIQSMVSEMINQGAKRIGMKDIFEQIRKEHGVKAMGCVYKINNNYTSYYARLLILKYRNLEAFIELRELKRAA